MREEWTELFISWCEEAEAMSCCDSLPLCTLPLDSFPWRLFNDADWLGDLSRREDLLERSWFSDCGLLTSECDRLLFWCRDGFERTDTSGSDRVVCRVSRLRWDGSDIFPRDLSVSLPLDIGSEILLVCESTEELWCDLSSECPLLFEFSSSLENVSNAYMLDPALRDGKLRRECTPPDLNIHKYVKSYKLLLNKREN